MLQITGLSHESRHKTPEVIAINYTLFRFISSKFALICWDCFYYSDILECLTSSALTVSANEASCS